MIIELINLPKLSLNKWYASAHWTERKRIKDVYKVIIKSQFRKVFPKDKVYVCKYVFIFKSRPLDSSNCVAMLKLIEDIIFEDDSYKIIPQLTMESKKGKEEKVIVEITEINNHE